MTTQPLHCVLIRDCDVQEPPQGAAYMAAISDEAVGSTGLWFGLIRIAPGHRTKAHTHPHETGIYLVKGSLELYPGEDMAGPLTMHERDFALIPEAVAHVAVNRSADVPVFAIVARSNPAHVEPAELVPQLDAIVT